MTLNLSENSWAKAGLIIALVLAVIGVWAYLAGGIFLMAYDHKFEEATEHICYTGIKAKKLIDCIENSKKRTK